MNSSQQFTLASNLLIISENAGSKNAKTITASLYRVI